MPKDGSDQISPAVQFRTVDEDYVGQRLDNYLLRELKGVPKTRIYRALRKGEVRVNKGRVKADYRLKIGDIVRVPPIRVPAPTETLKCLCTGLSSWRRGFYTKMTVYLC